MLEIKSIKTNSHSLAQKHITESETSSSESRRRLNTGTVPVSLLPSVCVHLSSRTNNETDLILQQADASDIWVMSACCQHIVSAANVQTDQQAGEAAELLLRVRRNLRETNRAGNQRYCNKQQQQTQHSCQSERERAALHHLWKHSISNNLFHETRIMLADGTWAKLKTQSTP